MLLILNYHLFSDQANADMFCVSPKALKDQLNIIRSLGIPVISLQEDSRALSEQFSVAITFDDGNRSDYEIALPLLDTFNFPATFFPYINNINADTGIGWKNLKILRERRFLIGSHGITHKALTGFSANDLNQELVASKKILEDKLGIAIDDFALPYGAYNNQVLEFAKNAGYKSIYTTGLRINSLAERLLFRWNITQRISLETFSKVLLSGGKLPFTTRLSSTLKHHSKKLLGTGISHYLNELR